MKRDINYIRSYERDLMEKDNKRNTLFNALWNMVYPQLGFRQGV